MCKTTTSPKTQIASNQTINYNIFNNAIDSETNEKERNKKQPTQYLHYIETPAITPKELHRMIEKGL
jgi:hypothetical protein